ncbi:hypothetical protein PMI21_00537, partial [Pseudomonas sp. GM18]
FCPKESSYSLDHGYIFFIEYRNI